MEGIPSVIIFIKSYRNLGVWVENTSLDNIYTGKFPVNNSNINDLQLDTNNLHNLYPVRK